MGERGRGMGGGVVNMLLNERNISAWRGYMVLLGNSVSHAHISVSHAHIRDTMSSPRISTWSKCPKRDPKRTRRWDPRRTRQKDPEDDMGDQTGKNLR